MSYFNKKNTAFTILLRVFSLLLVLTLLPSLPAAAEEKPAPKNLFGSELMDKSETVTSAAAVKDTLYFLTSTSLYAYTPGDEKAQRLTDSHVDVKNEQDEIVNSLSLNAIFSDGERLLGFNGSDQQLYSVSIEDGKLQLTDPVKLDVEQFMQGDGTFSYFEMPIWMQILDGKLYMKFPNYENKPADLYSFDLKTGEKTEHKVAHLQAITPYKDGTYLAVFKDPQQYYDEATSERVWPKLVVYDPKDESVTPHASGYRFDQSEVEIFSLYYDAAEDSLYTCTDTDLYRLDGDFKTPRLIGYLPTFGSFMQLPNAIFSLADGRLAILTGQNVFVRERTEAGLTDTVALTMAGSLDDPTILSRIMMEMDNVVIRRMEGTEYNQLTSEQMATLFLTGNIPADLMAINSQSFDMDNLIKKGYLVDLSGNEKITGFVNKMAPNLSSSLIKDGKIYGLPANTMVMPLTVYPERFKELGIEIPTSIMGLLDLVEQWVDGLGEKDPDYTLFSFGDNMQDSMRQYVFDRYVSYALGAGDELSFDTPIFRKLMEKLSSIDFGDYATDISIEQQMDDGFWQDVFSKKQLIEINAGFELPYLVSRNNFEGPEEQSQALVLPLEDGMDAFVEGDITLFSVLQTSEKKELAIEFLGNYVDKMDEIVKASFDLEANEPIINPNYEQEARQFAKYIADMEKQLREAKDEAVKSNLEQNIKGLKEEAEYQKQRNQYLATSDVLKMIHSYVSNMYIMSGRANAQRQAYYENYELRQQYFDGVISLDQFIKQMDDKLRLVRLEYQ
ncbi:MAG: hypothetical protein QM308_08085 [Bacillota bacterium]|nr:hypothetical protein [Bacillota bacterium]